MMLYGRKIALWISAGIMVILLTGCENLPSGTVSPPPTGAATASPIQTAEVSPSPSPKTEADHLLPAVSEAIQLSATAGNDKVTTSELKLDGYKKIHQSAVYGSEIWIIAESSEEISRVDICRVDTNTGKLEVMERRYTHQSESVYYMDVNENWVIWAEHAGLSHRILLYDRNGKKAEMIYSADIKSEAKWLGRPVLDGDMIYWVSFAAEYGLERTFPLMQYNIQTTELKELTHIQGLGIYNRPFEIHNGIVALMDTYGATQVIRLYNVNTNEETSYGYTSALESAISDGKRIFYCAYDPQATDDENIEYGEPAAYCYDIESGKLYKLDCGVAQYTIIGGQYYTMPIEMVEGKAVRRAYQIDLGGQKRISLFSNMDKAQSPLMSQPFSVDIALAETSQTTATGSVFQYHILRTESK